MRFVRLFLVILKCETHDAALLNRHIMRTSGIKFGDVNERCRSHTNWDVINIDLVTLQRLHRPGNGDWLEQSANTDNGCGDEL